TGVLPCRNRSPIEHFLKPKANRKSNRGTEAVSFDIFPAGSKKERSEFFAPEEAQGCFRAGIEARLSIF
ncbi:MAG TPA: hypothetical protein VJH94_04595, partial [Candidatus Paceibacterota bacterium]